MPRGIKPQPGAGVARANHDVLPRGGAVDRRPNTARGWIAGARAWPPRGAGRSQLTRPRPADIGRRPQLARGGAPQLTGVWFLHDAGELKPSLNASRQKTKNLRRRPQCSLFLLDLENPYKYVDIRGRARLEPDDDYAFADTVGAKYGGADLREHDGPGDSRVVVTVEPERVFAVDMGA